MAGRMTSSAARVASARPGGLPVPVRLDSGALPVANAPAKAPLSAVPPKLLGSTGTPGQQPPSLVSAGQVSLTNMPFVLAEAPGEDGPSPFADEGFNTRMLADLDTQPSPPPAAAASGRSVGWRRSIDMLTDDMLKEPPQPSQQTSIWRSITQSFARESRAGGEDQAGTSVTAFRQPAKLPDGSSPRDVIDSSAAGPGPSRLGTQLSGDGAPETADGRSLGHMTSSRRLRFHNEQLGPTANNAGGATSKGGSGVSSRATSRNQSFRERVANALGLGGLLARKSNEGLATIESSGLQPSQSVLKKEGTSKQLRLGLGADEDSGSDCSLTAIGVYQAAKESGAAVAGGAPGGGAGAATINQHSSISGEAIGSSAPLAASKVAARLLDGGRGGAAGVIMRPDSAVVPARLHVRTHDLDDPLELEATLMTPGDRLPPGEDLPSPVRRFESIMAKAKSRNNLAAGLTETGEALAPPEPTVTMPPMHAMSGMSAAGGPSVTFGAHVMEAPPPASAAAAGAGAGGNVVHLDSTVQSGKPVGKGAKARSTIKLPIITTGHWDSLVFATVWRVGRVFGFQAFNTRPSTAKDSKREYVPASIFVAADHLTQLLVKNGYVRRGKGEDTDDERFGKALFEFHSTIFYSYEMQWTKMQRLSARPQRFTDDLRERVFSDHHIQNGLLAELALYFLIYTESANLKYCSEAMWFIFWTMNHSYVMADIWTRGSPNRVPNGRDRMAQLRNTFQHLISETQHQLGIRPADMRPEDCGKLSSIMTRLSSSEVPAPDRELLADLVSFGDGGFFCDRITTPLFYVMSYEVDHLSTLGVDTAYRLGYDDFNESLTCREVVYSALMDLRVSPVDIATGALNDAYQSLSSMGFQGRTHIDNKFDPQVAATWWRNRVFVKTYYERRSWWGVYRAFFRVYAFHLVLFHLMQAQAFAGWDWRIISSAILTHAWLKWLERVANWMMTMPPPEPVQTTMAKIFDRKGFFRMDQAAALLATNMDTGGSGMRVNDRLAQMQSYQAKQADLVTAKMANMSVHQLRALQPQRVVEIEGTPMLGFLGGLLEWLAIAVVLTAGFMLQYATTAFQSYARLYWGYVAAGYAGLHLLHFLATTRDGYVISLTQALRLPAYFRNWSARPQPRMWMYNNMATNIKNFLANVFFWLLVFAQKIPFDYFVIHKPLVKPVRLLLTRNWLGCQGPVYRISSFTFPCVGGDWILVAARVIPFIIVALFDTMLFYQFVVTAFGIYHGLIKYDLGVVSSWEELVREFHKSPPRWWIRCMSFKGNENAKNLLAASLTQQAAEDEDGEGGGGGQGNVAVSDGQMFKIKIVTPEEIRRRQAQSMTAKGKVNMQAGKGAASNEVEGKGIKAVHGTTAPGTAANSRPATTATGTKPGAAAATDKSGAGSIKPISARGGAGHAALVGQDFKEGGAHGGMAAIAGLFARRGSATGGHTEAGSVPNVQQQPVGLFKDRRSSAPGEETSGGSVIGLTKGSATGDAQGGFGGLFRGRTGSATGDLQNAGARQGSSTATGASGGMVGAFKALGTAALGTAAQAVISKKNQVQPEPIAEAREDEAAHGMEDGSAGAPGSSRSRAPSARAAVRQQGLDVLLRPRHPAWQPDELLGPRHTDYDPAADPMSEQSLRKWPLDEPAAEQAMQQRWRLWPFHGGAVAPSAQPADGEMAGAHAGPGVRSASHLPQAAGSTGYGSDGEIEAWREPSSNSARNGHGSNRALRGPVAEATMTDGDSDDGYGSQPPTAPRGTRPPVVLLEEVPIMRADSDRTDVDGPDGASDASNGDGIQASGLSPSRPDGGKSGKFKALSVSLPDAYEDNVNLRAPKSAKAPKSILAGQDKPPRAAPRQRRASFFQALFGANVNGAPGEAYAGDDNDDAEEQQAALRGGASKAALSRHELASSSKFDAARHDRSMRGDRSVRGSDRSMTARRMSLGPAAAIGFGMQRQKSMTAGGLSGISRQKSITAGTGSFHRTKSVTAGTSAFDQKQFAKNYESRHSIAAQAVRKDIATRTTSMVLMADELQNLEEEDLDVVSEQMMMWSSFAEAWDAICSDLREDDLISDLELKNLAFVRLESSGKLHGLRPILLPTFFFAGQIRKVIDTGRVNTAQVMVLTEFRVLVTWLSCQLGIMSGKHAHVIMTTALYGGIINVKHISLRKKAFDAAIKLVGLIEEAIRKRDVPFDVTEFAEHLNTILRGLESECYAIQKMWELGRADDEDLDGALTLFEVVRDMQDRFRNDPEELKQCLKRAVAMEDATTNTNVLLQVTTVLRQMLTTTAAEATPQGEEAQRVLSFFINSLGHPSLDKPESLEFMLSWSVLTPAYEEDVLYAVDSGLSAEELGLPKKKITDLLSETDDGFTLMAYLRAMFAFEWSNFKERLRRQVGAEVDIPDWSQVTELDFGPGGLLFEYRLELQLWASFRGQLLARTVRGMMCYERALKVLCRMEYPAPVGITDADYERWVDNMVASKFEYVVAVQTYGRNSRSQDLRLRQLAQGVDTLVQRFPTLKVAYLDDAVDPERHVPTQYSVLNRNRRAADPIVDPTQPFNKIVEAYRIRLPINRYSNRGVVLGEGKPENQNHSIVFAFNEGLQAIDMNQDNYLAEALKMRNLLSELHPSNKGAQYMLFADDSDTQVLSPHMTAAELRFLILSRMKRAFPTAIVGFREWIFSANTGALGQYAAATEYAFATIQSRIMTKPARVRMHYGHPDVFNKTHIMTRGGMSKGTRTLHISEDYFIGAAHTLRGARIRYKEYISCGKGRDMGFDSILGYQKKISGGGADLATSREVHRLGTRLDFFRLMSFYHGGLGHYLNSYLTLIAAWYNIWALLLTALANAMELGVSGEPGQVSMTQTYNVQQVLQLGTLAIIPYVGQLILETGLLRTAITVFGQIVTGSLFFYIFQQQTVAASFSGVMAYGGMRYIGTGRGFSIQTTDFVKLYTMYARTHLYLGFEVLFFCATLFATNDCSSCNYAALTWNSWLLAFTLILCPLWFNPFIFNLSKVQREFVTWKRWLAGDMDSGTGTNWYTWNREQLSKLRNDDGNVTDAWRNGFREVLGTCLPYALLVLAMVSKIRFKISEVPVLQNPYMEFVLATALLWMVTAATWYLGHYFQSWHMSRPWRITRYVLTLVSAVLFVAYLAVLNRFYEGDGFTHLMRVAYANLMLIIMFHKAATYLFTQNNAVRDFVDAGYYLIDLMVGFAMFAVLALLSFVGIVALLQSKLLFNEAFSQSVQTARIRQQVKKSGKQIRRKPKPGLLMTMDEWMRSRPGSAASHAPSMAPTMFDGGGVSRAVSLAPSMLPSAFTSAAPSIAASVFTSTAVSRNTSRRNSLDEMVHNLIRRNQQGNGNPGLEGPSNRGEVVESASSGLDGAGNDAGLRERRLRFG
ncbi:hypothetical protein HXX76_002351 [Chlamydomonas incerta]|uniref:1,3-beta-glucan synthase n=1 Tax=Chlamydomonas incerta TaxID=51695 RepID=A0A835TKL9_CHLIN|nr:hypothetical protein HXX76_002351 [Chlamydomonas incerta]|eukprot:KAG2442264.1 hypothetical protein HXX76_002351 [Chlamydomonas incerta]